MGEARDRVHLFLDPDIPFLELGAFAGYKLDSSSHPWTLFLSVVARWDRVRVREHQILDSVDDRAKTFNVNLHPLRSRRKTKRAAPSPQETKTGSNR